MTGRPRKIKNAKHMNELWEQFKAECDNYIVLTHDFSGKNSEFVSKELKRKISYTIKGFCVFARISCTSFYEYYANDKRFVATVSRMKEECEVDARAKFETGQIPPQLAALWMSNHGYSTNPKSDDAIEKITEVLSEIKRQADKDENTS